MTEQLRIEDLGSIHFTGIGGIGMSALARFALKFGLQVSGSDSSASDLTRELEKEGVTVCSGQETGIPGSPDLLVYSSAVPVSDPDRMEARQRNIPEMRRAEFLAAVCSAYGTTVAAAGTHGKTTVSSMITVLLDSAGLAPSALIGGIIRNYGSNMLLNDNRGIIVVEADEYDRSFLTLKPEINIITNIDLDHLDIYRDMDDILDTFAEYAGRISPKGINFVCSDNENIRSLLPRIPSAATYGISDTEASVRAADISSGPEGSSFRIIIGSEDKGYFNTPLTGNHNILNSLVSAAAAFHLGADAGSVRKGLAEFRGAKRRFELRRTVSGVRFIDDYAHHPAEIRACLESARLSSGQNSRLIAVFQPHLFSRTRDLAGEFAEALSLADQALVLDIYPAREKPVPGVTSELITAHMRADSTKTVGNISGLAEVLPGMLRSGDTVVLMGAGDLSFHIDELADMYAGRTDHDK